MKQRVLLGILAVAAASQTAPSQQSTPTMPFRDPSLPLDRRIDDLVSRLTLEEKISQLMNDSPAIDRLGIPAYNWWNESLHGVARAGRATVFPQAIGLAATFDADNMLRVSTAISDEARAKFHEFQRRGKRNIYQGLTFWTPNINLFRDPRWGRGMETYGEDPYLTGRMAVSFIKGMQGDDPNYLKTVATAKHFAVHSGPESTRHAFDAKIGERDLRESYLPHFEMAVREGGATSVMCAYNSVDGEPACGNTRLLDDILRKEWGFKGYVVSDCGAIEDIYKGHRFRSTAPEAAARGLKTGTDLNCGVEYENLLPAVRTNLVAEADIDRSLKRLLNARFRLGLFDPPARVKYAQIPYSENGNPAHARLALETARKSIVLLKNENNTLPLSKSIKTLAVIGPNADDVDVMLGNYNGIQASPMTPLAGLKKKLGAKAKVVYARGTELAVNMHAFEVIPARYFGNGLKGEYYPYSNFDGQLHRPRELTVPSSGKQTGTIPQNPTPLFTRADPQVDFNWWDGAPRQDLNDDDFGVRWTGTLSTPVSGTYELGAVGMNAFELYLDGRSIVRFNSIHSSAIRSAPVQLEAGKQYAIRLDFHEYLQDASIHLVWSRPDMTREQDALDAARQADAVVMVMGLSPRLEGEEMQVPVEGYSGGDRVSIGIPKIQEDLMQKVMALKKPTVLVLMNGSALAVNWARDNVPAIVESWYPGQAGGDALADVLFGDYNPAGRLPVTFYKSLDQLPPFMDYSMKQRTYRFFTGEPLFPFGYGLSYTTFAYRNLSVPKQAKAGAEVKVSVEVENTGVTAGEEVVQLYVTTSTDGPIRSLAGFKRVSLKPHERMTVPFTLTGNQLSHFTPEGKRVAFGEVQIAVGGKQPGFKGPTDAATTSVVTGSLKLN
jgi:beta-glucosidase